MLKRKKTDASFHEVIGPIISVPDIPYSVVTDKIGILKKYFNKKNRFFFSLLKSFTHKRFQNAYDVLSYNNPTISLIF
jgi:hypothetical protein